MLGACHTNCCGLLVELSADHPIPHLGTALIMESLGTADCDFYAGLLTQLANVGTARENTRRTGNELYVGNGEGYWPEGRN